MAFSRLARIPTRNALLAAQHLNATGMKVDPGVYTNRFLQGLGVMSRQAGYGAGSAGRALIDKPIDEPAAHSGCETNKDAGENESHSGLQCSKMLFCALLTGLVFIFDNVFMKIAILSFKIGAIEVDGINFAFISYPVHGPEYEFIKSGH